MPIGYNVYLHGYAEQDRILVECIAPLARNLLATGACERFTCDRFDARGPHITAIFCATPASESDVTTRVERAISVYLSRLDNVELGLPTEIETRHAACRGRTLCRVDGEPGMAQPGTFRVFDVSEGDYPFSQSEGAAEAAEIWRLRTELTLWAIEQIDARRTKAIGAAIRWIAAFDQVIGIVGAPHVETWNYLIEKSTGDFTNRVASGELRVNEGPLRIAEANRATFTRLWREATIAADGGCDLLYLVRLILADDGRPLDHRLWLLRSTVYNTMQLLGVRKRVYLPLYLFAWTGAVEAASREAST